MDLEGESSYRRYISVEHFKSFESVKAIQKEWDEFMELVGAGIYLTYDWCRIWWDYYGKDRELLIIVLRCDGAICALLPLFYENVGIGLAKIRRVKIVGSDFIPVTIQIPIRQDQIDEAIGLIYEELRQGERWDLIHLGSISGRCEATAPLLKRLRNHGDSIRTQEKFSGDQIYFKIGRSWNDQMAELSRENRRGMRRYYEKLLDQGASVKCIYATDENIDDMFEQFVQTHQEHWKFLGQAGHFSAWPEAYNFHREMARTQLRWQRLRLYKICVNDLCIGYHYAYKFGDTYHYFLFARKKLDKADKIDFFRIDFGEMVKQAMQEKVSWLDTLRGKYDYQLKLGGQLYSIREIFIQRRGVVCSLRINLLCLMAWILDLTYSKLWRRRVCIWLGLKLGQFWKIWLRTNTLP
jgi:CelD/BcsL family acetyltransferase involved in cellulose biosynthesis